jgi:hypothetical protein
MSLWEEQILVDLRDIKSTGDFTDGSWWEGWAWDMWTERADLYCGAADHVPFILWRAAVRRAINIVGRE